MSASAEDQYFPSENGDGTQKDPFQITSEKELRDLATLVNAGNATYNAAYYLLSKDITLSDGDWTPIGKTSSSYAFKGKFDGGSHKITGLRIRSSDAYQGLFGYVSGGAVISNLGVDVDIETSGSYAGGIVGYLYSSNIENCYVLGAVKGYSYAGGVAGYMYTSSSVKNCYSAVMVSGANYVGGVAGYTYINANISLESCYSSGDVSGNNYVGGVLGYAGNTSSPVKNCVALNPSVTATSSSLGYVVSTAAANATNCWYLSGMSLGDKTPTGTKGTPIGKDKAKEAAFWTEASGTGAAWDNIVWSFADGRYPILASFNDATQATPRITITAQPVAETTVTEGRIKRYLSVSAGATLGADLSYQWYSNDTNSTEYGTLIYGETSDTFTIPTDLAVGTYYYYCVVSADGGESVTSSAARVNVIEETAVGDGTLGSPLQIYTKDDLLDFVKRVEDDQNPETSLCAILTADLSFDEWTAIGWNSSTAYVGSISYAGPADSPTPFKGVFNGNGHTLTLKDEAGKNNNALFHTIAPEGAVENLRLVVNFKGKNNVAGVAVRNYGKIERVTVEGTIIASQHAGGIVAYNGRMLSDAITFVSTPEILDCVNKAAVSGTASTSYVGGIAACFVGKMIRSGNEGPVTGTASIGGLIGTLPPNPTQKKQPVKISDCYNAGNVTSTGAQGGLVGDRFGYASDFGLGYFQISNTFSYGDIAINDAPGTIIATVQNEAYNDYEVYFHFANTYYREGIGSTLFYAASSNLSDENALGTDTVKKRIISKTKDEFASLEMARLLNKDQTGKDRTGDDAPWEYVEGADYPTFKWAGDGTGDDGNPVPNDPSGGGNTGGTGGSGGGGSSGTDGSANASVVIDTSTDPEASAAVVTLPEGSVVYDQATGTATVPAEEIDAAIDQAIETAAASGGEVSGIKIVVPDVAGATTVVVPISVTKLEAAAGSPQETLTLGMTAVGTVTMDKAAVRELISEAGSAETVDVVIEQKAAKDGGGLDDIAEIPGLTEPQKDALADDESLRAVYDVHLAVDGPALEDFETRGTLTIRLHYRLQGDEVPEGIGVVYVPEKDGPTERMNDTRYDQTEELAVFTTNHLSIYAVTYAPGVTNENTNNTGETDLTGDGGSSGGCDAGAAGFALLVFAMIAASAARKKTR